MNKFSTFFALVFLFTSCNDHNLMHREVTISTDNIAALKQKYTPEVFTYFYETVFFSDRLQKKLDITTKWEQNIKISISGQPYDYELENLKAVVKLINQQGLPIKLSIIDKESEANFKFHFGTKEELDSLFDLSFLTAGITKTDAIHGRIRKVELGIIRNEDTSDKKRKRAVILEEMIQSLGVTGDSFTYPKSIFFEAQNYQDEFIELDREILQLLYDPLMPVNYPRKKFEVDFADVLYTLNTTERLKQYCKENDISKNILDQIKNSCFIDGVFFKHPRQVDFYLYGEYEAEDSINIQKNIAAINHISEYLQISLQPFANYFPSSGIILNFKHNQEQEFTVRSEIRTDKGVAMFPKRVRNEVDIRYKTGKEGQRKRNKAITKVIYKCIGPIETKNLDDLYTDEGDSIRFGPDFKEIIKIIYQPEFADGYTLREFEQLIAELYPEEIVAKE